jgi:hypothetical protein
MENDFDAKIKELEQNYLAQRKQIEKDHKYA